LAPRPLHQEDPAALQFRERRGLDVRHGKQIVSDRLKDNADIVLIGLPKKT
jgi:hypothetical protein